MNLPEIFRNRIYIRLEGDAFICTVQYGGLYGRLTRYAIDPPGPEERNARRLRSAENLIYFQKPPNAA